MTARADFTLSPPLLLIYGNLPVTLSLMMMSSAVTSFLELLFRVFSITNSTAILLPLICPRIFVAVASNTETMERRPVLLHTLHRRTTLTGTLDELLDPKEDEDVIRGFIRLKVTDKPVGLASLTQLREIYPLLIECESRSFESDESSITLTVEEYEEMQTDPVKVFDSFCREICDGEPSEHLHELFMNAVTMTEEEEQ